MFLVVLKRGGLFIFIVKEIIHRVHSVGSKVEIGRDNLEIINAGMLDASSGNRLCEWDDEGK